MHALCRTFRVEAPSVAESGAPGTSEPPESPGGLCKHWLRGSDAFCASDRFTGDGVAAGLGTPLYVETILLLRGVNESPGALFAVRPRQTLLPFQFCLFCPQHFQNGFDA